MPPGEQKIQFRDKNVDVGCKIVVFQEKCINWNISQVD